MAYLEMSRDETHGGGAWSFPNCVWAPTHTKSGTNWPFWSKVGQIKEGDIVLHLRGKRPNAFFVGYSRASGDGFETSRRPPEPGEWEFAARFYRADLSDFTPLHEPVNLDAIFSHSRQELEEYFDANRKLGPRKANIFFVRQAGRIQCLNGAYLSDLDDPLLDALFGNPDKLIASDTAAPIVSVTTGSQIASVHTRIGQKKFSDEIKDQFGNRCCFPGCPVSDPRFLIASHIARWSDNEKLRGHLGNGLCFCLHHDKAFELGLFTLDEDYRVFMNPREIGRSSNFVSELAKQHGQQISLANIHPLHDALLEHWIRVDIEPFENGT